MNDVMDAICGPIGADLLSDDAIVFVDDHVGVVAQATFEGVDGIGRTAPIEGIQTSGTADRRGVGVPNEVDAVYPDTSSENFDSCIGREAIFFIDEHFGGVDFPGI